MKSMNRYIPIILAGVLGYWASPESQAPTTMSKWKVLVTVVKQRVDQMAKIPYDPKEVLKDHDNFFIKMEKWLADHKASQIKP